MPSQTIHFAVAHEYMPAGTGEYYFGNIAPDYTDSRSIKDFIHLRDKPDRLKAMTELRDKINLDNAFEFGWLMHLYTDSIWDVTVVPWFHEQYKGGGEWFREYREELGKLSRSMYKTLPWVPGVVRSLYDFDFDELFEIAQELPVPLSLNWFRDYIISRHEAERDNSLEVFSIEMAEDFARSTAASFREFLK